MADVLFSKANEEYVNDNYQRAVDLYSEALQVESEREDILCSRAQAFIKLEKHADAVGDCDAALKVNPSCYKAFLRKGMALYHQRDYRNALNAFQEAKKLNGEGDIDEWLQKCETELNRGKQEEGGDGDKPTSGTPGAKESQIPPASSLPPPSLPKTRHDWYQTHTHVVITILLKNAKEEDLTCNIQEKSLSVSVKLPTGSDYSLELDLAHPILPDQSNPKVYRTKIEINLKKKEGIQWTKLEDDGEKTPAVKLAVPGNSGVPLYPSSKPGHVDWNQVEREVIQQEKEEKKEGDEALNSLFHQIYADGSDEVKKAMVKSFYESGGTVLSTNWGEVKQQKVEVKPPDGMEYKKWSE